MKRYRAKDQAPNGNGQLSWQQSSAYAEKYGDAFYIFDSSRFRDNFSQLKSAFTTRYRDTRIAYSYKTNYTPAICKALDEMGGYSEVVSEMEYDLARRLGIKGPRIIYNGPYKSVASLRDALRAGAIVNLDSMRDYAGVMALAAESPQRTFSVGIRCNFAVVGDAASRFGVDVDGPDFRTMVAGIRASRNVRLAGLHCHFPNRDLASFRSRTRQLLDITRKTFTSPPEFLDVGGGFFGRMPMSLSRTLKTPPPDFGEYAETVCGLLNQEYARQHRKPTLFIEPGTALVADTLKFYARVVTMKTVRGRQVATVAGSIFNISPHARVCHLPVRILRARSGQAVGDDTSHYDIAGYTCIEDDFLTKALPGPLEVGDFLEYSNVGSYSIVMKPPFILPNVPILSTTDRPGALRVIKRSESTGTIFSTFAGW